MQYVLPISFAVAPFAFSFFSYANIQSVERQKDLYYDIQKYVDLLEEEELNLKFGFKRPEFTDKLVREEMVGKTGALFQKHIVICRGIPVTQWDDNLDRKGFAQNLKRYLSQHVTMPQTMTSSENQKEPILQVKISSTDEKSKHQIKGETSTEEKYDLMIFPDMIKLIGVTEVDFPLVADYFSAKTPLSENVNKLETEQISGSVVFVSCQINADPRIKFCGPKIFRRFKTCSENITSSKVKNQLLEKKNFPIQVFRISDLGGRKYEPNVIVYRHRNISNYTGNPNFQDVCGDWYGFVEEEEGAVEKIIDLGIAGGKVIPENWRGRCGVSENVAKIMHSISQ